MKRKITFDNIVFTAIILIFMLPSNAFSLNYTITFTSSGASTTLDNVIVENITKGTTITVPAGSSLFLTDVVTSMENINSGTSSISVYPNPIIDNSTVSFQAKTPGDATINIFSLEGKNIISTKSQFNQGNNSFQLSLPKGTYLLQISVNDYTYSAKVISQSNSSLKAKVSFTNNENTIKSKIQKTKNTLTTMLYTDGDQLLYRGKSGNYTAIVTDRPTTSKTTNFDFVECKDADGNYYATVKIGSQIWMAENLKTTKYNDNVSIPNITDNTSWAALSTGSYCDYNNTPTNSIIYGKLYNWHVVNTSKFAPTGWHVPTASEWAKMENYLHINGYSLDSSNELYKLGKSLAANINWNDNNTNGTVGNDLSKNNNSGFSALPAGRRYYDGGDSNLGISAIWWCMDDIQNMGNSSCKYIDNDNHSIIHWTGTYMASKPTFGFSVRCVYDNYDYTNYTTFIGDTYAGGIVFYVDETGKHGLVCATHDQGSGLNWQEAYNACETLTLNDYTDWYMPTLSELTLLKNNLYKKSMGGFNTIDGGYYWSSTPNGANMYYYETMMGNPYYALSSSSFKSIRAIREF